MILSFLSTQTALSAIKGLKAEYLVALTGRKALTYD
jgi:hypothetical protein